MGLDKGVPASGIRDSDRFGSTSANDPLQRVPSAGRKRADRISQVFHHLGTPDQLMVGWTGRLSGQPPTLAALRSHVHERLSTLPALTHRLTTGSRAPHWEPASPPDLRKHVHALRVANPAAWQDAPSQAQALPLPPEHHPRWDLWLITRHDVNHEYVLLLRIHHALADGAGILHVAHVLLALPPWQGTTRPQPPQALGLLRDTREACRLTRDVAASLRPGRPAPPFHQLPTGRRSYASASVSTQHMRELAGALDTSISKAFLTALAATVRGVALSDGTAPTPLAVFWPLSTRQATEQEAAGNFISMARIWLPCDDGSPASSAERIAAQLVPEAIEQRVAASRRLLRHAPPGTARWMIRRCMRGRLTPLTATYLSVSGGHTAAQEGKTTGFSIWGAPVPTQLCHVTLTRFGDQCELSVVYDEALSCGAAFPRLWQAALDNLREHA
ncbi:wax ester/triacylglycerol synthase domain-containing protein [Streptomyces chrestomyceticus]|uniref:wax ester/triacylglycerol synthase domain-containing protein n=1 Tax=Streptomyces chrestomyceticus TaxID=68185 RepID=UPI0033E15BC6